MRKVFFPVSVIAMMLVSSCQKENQTPTSSNEGTPHMSTMQKEEPYGCYFTNVKLEKPCICYPSNCCVLDEVVIKAPGKDKVKGTAGAGKSKKVAAVFMEPEMQEVVNALPPDLARKLQSGEYEIMWGYDNESSCKFIAGKGKVSEDNYEFALQLRVQD